jgi:hypothetical protein
MFCVSEGMHWIWIFKDWNSKFWIQSDKAIIYLHSILRLYYLLTTRAIAGSSDQVSRTGRYHDINVTLKEP